MPVKKACIVLNAVDNSGFLISLSAMDFYDPSFIQVYDPVQIQKEKARARRLRESAWWKKKRSSGICYYCGRRFLPANLTMDHIIPISRGGRSNKENIVPCCKDCNSQKKYLLPAEWQDYLERLKKQSEN